MLEKIILIENEKCICIPLRQGVKFQSKNELNGNHKKFLLIDKETERL